MTYTPRRTEQSSNDGSRDVAVVTHGHGPVSKLPFYSKNYDYSTSK